ncbi:sensor histidine kinase [Anaeromyxobacter sp. Fw109-5]|uniref:sensor histidine kinase n=1 Tax=Anaeromyxobacter sp. (strain Fw109-5) TaxID=404589 RepID=UPI001F2BBAE8|nr:sensor histidine kinase [Anaeromyxobacter sp. Fw109-5]
MQRSGDGTLRRRDGRWRSGIGARTLATMLLVAIPSLLAFSLLVRGAAGDLLRGRTEAHIQTVAQSSARGVEELVRRGEHSALALATSTSIVRALGELEDGRADTASVAALGESFLAAQRLDPAIQAVRLVDVEGNEVVKAREGELTPAHSPVHGPLGLPAIQSLRGRPFFEEALRAPRGSVTISDLERGRVEGEEDWCPAMVRFATPLFFQSGARAGVLIVNVWGAEVGAMLNRLVPAEQGAAFLVERNAAAPDRSGVYLFHQDGQCEFGNQTGSRVTAWQQYPRELVDSWMKTDAGIAMDPRTGDLLAHVYYSPYARPDRGWVVVLAAREAYFARPLERLQASVLGLSALVVAGTVVAALLLSRTLTQPLRTLAAGVRAIGDDLSVRVPVRGGREVAIVAESVNRMAGALQEHLETRERSERQLRETEKLASIGEMAAGLAHELNTPLSNIRALASLARRDLDAGRVELQALKADLADVADQTRRCTTIIDGLLRFARRQPPALAAHDVNRLVHGSLALVRLRAEKKGVTLAFEAGAAQAAVVDAAQLEQVFVNLLLNAVDAARPGGRVEVSTATAGGRIAVRVSDDGAGIAPEHLPRIFDPFFTTKAVGEGTGLGLSVSYGIVRNHGGALSVDSAPGRGATFTVSLPLGTP